MAAATQYGLSMVASFENEMSQENPILSGMADLEPLSQTSVGCAQSHTVEVKSYSVV